MADTDPSSATPAVRQAVDEHGRHGGHGKRARPVPRAYHDAMSVALLLALTAVDPDVLAAQAARVAVIERITPPVVCIFAPKGDNGGSGVLINAGGEALTNFHVVAGLGPFIKCGLPDGQLYWAVVKAVDPTGDLALIKLTGRDEFPHARLGDSSELRPGDPALVLGNPFLLADDYQPTVTFGVISGVRRYQYPSNTFLEYTDCIQTDAAINPGNSGGPLFNARGELVGINGRASFEKRGRVYTGAGYAISINQAKNFLDHLRSGRIADHGTADMTVATLPDGRVAVRSVAIGSDPERLGIEEGDEVVRFGGRPIETANEFKNVLGISPAGWRVPITVRSPEGETRTVAIRLQPLHTQAELVKQTTGNPFGGPPQPGVPTGSDQSDVPEELRPLHEEAPGYTNRYWNTVERDRVLRTVREWKTAATWRLSGATAGGDAARLAVSPKGVGFEAGELAATAAADAPPADKPPGTGGLLTAIGHLHAMLGDPEAFFTDWYYLGSEPLYDAYTADGGRRVDTMLATRGQATTRFHFDRETADLVAMETQLAPDADPCTIRFGDPATLGEITLPQSWEVRHAGQDVVTVRWE